MPELTPIEQLAKSLASKGEGPVVVVMTVLVPEQCMEIEMGGQVYHVSIDEEGK